tara:strand:+ start:3951 stop:5552 length:1602 start_codon:yes stop_codon:yes gene_type:complete
MKGLKELKKAKKGSIVPIYETMNRLSNAEEYFEKISDYGRKKNSILFESADIITKYGEKSIGSANPCLKVKGKKERFEITALNDLGKRFLKEIKKDLSFCDSLKIKKNKITGILKSGKKVLSEEERLRGKTHADILRAIAFKLKPAYKPFEVYAGLMGAIAYDFIDQFEKIPKSKKDVLKEPDYEMNFYDNLFLIDHKKKQITFIANAMIFDKKDKKKELKRCGKTIENYKNAMNSKIPSRKKPSGKKPVIKTDTNKKEFMKIVSNLKKHVLEGDVFQVVPSRTIISTYTAEPLDIYDSLRKLNPSPYMFYFKNSTGTLLGSSPETFIKVDGNKKKKIQIRPIAGTVPRGKKKGKINKKLDEKYAKQLRNDKKEMAEHTMLIDLARNDVAKVSIAGTRICERPYSVEKYSHVQHLVSYVSGILKPDLDALHAYLASMNMGTLTGAPKVEAMKLIRKSEKTRRGFYGGSIGYLTPSGDFDSAIVIRSMSLQKGKAYVRAGAGIVYDSKPEKEFLETEKKARAALKAIQISEVKK